MHDQFYALAQKAKSFASTNLTSAVWYEIYQGEDGEIYIKLVDSGPLKGREAHPSPGTFSNQYFRVKSFTNEQINSDSSLELGEAYNENGEREKPKSVNVTKGFLKAALKHFNDSLDI